MTDAQGALAASVRRVLIRRHIPSKKSRLGDTRQAAGSKQTWRDSRNCYAALRSISPAVLDLPDVVIADRNASSDHVRFGPAPAALALVDGDRVFAEYWTHPNDQIEEWIHKSIKCAEVLVPDRVGPTLVTGAYVSCAASRDALLAVAPRLRVSVNAHLFFR